MICGNPNAPFLFTDKEAGTDTRYCGIHVPEDWGIPKLLKQRIEEELIAKFEAELKAELEAELEAKNQTPPGKTDGARV